MQLFNGENIEFKLSGLTLRGRRWGAADGIPVLAAHGWLDNCASFDLLAPRLKKLNLIALDLAGHGLSDHRSTMAAYNIWQDVAELLAVADLLQWRNFALLGHSRGAMIAMLLAGSFPERVTHLALLEAIAPQPQAAEEAPAQLASSINVLKSLSEKPRRYYPSFADAVRARSKGIIELAEDDAALLAKRGVLKTEQGYYWSNDYKVMAPSEFKLTLEHINAFMDCINLNIQVIAGHDGLVKSFHGIDEWIAQFPQLKVAFMEGGHHLHMSENVEKVAFCLNEYFSRSAHSA